MFFKILMFKYFLQGTTHKYHPLLHGANNNYKLHTKIITSYYVFNNKTVFIINMGILYYKPYKINYGFKITK